MVLVPTPHLSCLKPTGAVLTKGRGVLFTRVNTHKRPLILCSVAWCFEEWPHRRRPSVSHATEDVKKKEREDVALKAPPCSPRFESVENFLPSLAVTV